MTYQTKSGNQSYSDTEWALLLFYKNGGGNKKVLQNVARFTENKDICSYKTKVNLQKTKKTTRYGYNEEAI